MKEGDRMKKKLKFTRVIFCVLSILLICLNSKTTFAAEKTQNGLTTDISYVTNLNGQTEATEVSIKITVTNYNTYTVNNISIKSILPEGLEMLESENLTSSIQTLAPNASYEMTLQVKTTNAESSTESPSSVASNPTVTDGVIPISEVDNNIVTKSSSTPETSDSGGNILFFVITLVGSSFLIAMGFKYKKKFKKAIAIILIFSMTFPMLSHISLKSANAQTLDNYMVTEILKIDNEEYSFQVVTNYEYERVDDGKTYTRQEWIQLIANNFDIKVENIDKDNIDYFYGDTMYQSYEVLAEYEYSCGILPAPDSNGYVDPDQDIPLFEADKIVTREYAIYSIIKACGFEGTYVPDCGDVTSLKFPNQVAIGLKFGIINLIDGKFMPDKEITTDDVNAMFSGVRALNASADVKDSEVKNKISYLDGVLVNSLAQTLDYSITLNDDSTYTVKLPKNEATSQISEGTIYILPANEKNINGQTFKAKVVIDNGDTLTVTSVQPELYETYREIDIAKSVTPDVVQFIPDEGVTCEIEDSAEQSAVAEIYPLGGHKTSTESLKISINKDLGNNTKLVGKVSFSVPDVTAIVDLDFGWFDVDVNEVTFSITEAAVIEAGLEFQGEEGSLTNNKFKLGKLSIPIYAGISADITPYLYYEASGEVKISFEVEATQGIQYRDGVFRNLCSLDSRLDSIKVGGSASTGLKLTCNLAAFGIGVVGVEGKTGIGISASSKNHPDIGLYCLDATVYALLEFGISSDSLVGELMDTAGVNLSYVIFDDENSPLKKSIHFENLEKVDVCTYGNGKFDITVNDENSNPIQYARVVIYDADDKIVGYTFTDSNGKCVKDNLSVGYYTLKISATGYKTYRSSEERIKKRETTYLETLLMVDRDDLNESNTVSGQVINGLTGNVIDASYKVFKDYNNTTGRPVLEGMSSQGNYSEVLPAGNYTLFFEAEGFVSNSINVAVFKSKATMKNVILVPKEGTSNGDVNFIDSNSILRIVLTWGANPSDLDSHLFANSYHIYYSNKGMSENGTQIANLDVDDTSSYGPETTTIYDIDTNDYYSFSVHDFSNKYSDNSSSLSMSGACIKVYSGSNLVATYNVPVGYNGTVWNVFNYDPSKGTISSVNTFTNSNTSNFRPVR